MSLIMNIASVFLALICLYLTIEIFSVLRKRTVIFLITAMVIGLFLRIAILMDFTATSLMMFFWLFLALGLFFVLRRKSQ